MSDYMLLHCLFVHSSIICVCLILLSIQIVETMKPQREKPHSVNTSSYFVHNANNLALPADYNRHLRPSHKGPADEVEVGIQVYSIGPISEADMTMTLDMYFRTKWYDKRLKETVDSLLKNDEILAKWERIKAATAQISKQHKQAAASSSSESNQYEQETYGEAETELLAQIQIATFDDPTANLSFSGGNTSRSVVTLGQEYAEAIWTPDLYFPDAIEILRPGKGLISDSMVLALYDDCELFQSMRLQVKSRCKLELRWFPMDIQRCEICVESYQYHTDDVRILFWEKKVVLDGERLEKYGTANFYIDYDNSWNRTIERESFNYNYVTLCLGVKLVRKLSIYVITMYLPSISLVALSWVGFWIDKRAIPARASLSITTILAEITLITGTANQFPGIADLKMADLYLIVNFFFVFASLIEFALVSYEPPVRSQTARKTMDFAKTIFKTRQSNNLQPPSISETSSMKNGEFVHRPDGKSSHETSFIAKSCLTDNSNNTNDSLCVISNKIVNRNSISNSPKQKPKTLRLQDNPIEVVVDMHDFSQVRNRGAKKPKRVSTTNSLGYHEDRVSGGRGKLFGIINLDSFSKDNADEVSKWLFPLAFTVWNVAYFVMGMTLAGRWPFNIILGT